MFTVWLFIEGSNIRGSLTPVRVPPHCKHGPKVKCVCRANHSDSRYPSN